jgi:hypothetical protein
MVLIVTALGFVAVFAVLASRFNYPDVLERGAAEVLPALAAGGAPLRFVWWVYAFLPLALLPAAAGTFEALRTERSGLLRFGTYCAVLSALALTLGLIRWPSLNAELARVYVSGSPEARPAIEVVYTGFNRYLGTYIGEQLGEILLNAWFAAVAVTMLRSRRFARWTAWFGIVVSFLGMLGVFRFATPLVEPIAAVNNLLLPLWLIVLGGALLRFGSGRVTDAPELHARQAGS